MSTAPPAALPTPPARPALPAPPPPSSRSVVLALSFVASLAAGVATNGIYFLNKIEYQFTTLQNYAVGLLVGLTYIASASFAGRFISILRRRFPGLSTRAILCALLSSMGLLCLLPTIAGALTPGGRAAWSVWLFIGLYSPATGILWPVVESFLAGGRSGEELRRTTGSWNVAWSASLVVGIWGISPLLEKHAPLILILLVPIHLLAAAISFKLGREPGIHLPEHHEPHPQVYHQLLVTFRLMLPMSYVVTASLGPYIPSAMAQLEVPTHWHTILGAWWLLPRSLGFWFMQHWQGWHGKWSTAVLAVLLVISGFAASVMAPASVGVLGSRAAALWLMVAGLTVFGAGIAVVYSAAIYYALEVGQAEVDAGGKHEALIGAGYTLGPMCGMLASYAVQQGIIPESRFNAAVLGGVGVVVLLVGIEVLRRVFGRPAPDVH